MSMNYSTQKKQNKYENRGWEKATPTSAPHNYFLENQNNCGFSSKNDLKLIKF